MFGIMTDNRLFVGGETHIEFKTIAAVFQRKIKCSKSIFRDRLERASTTMTE